jgi:hypothetical protein
MEMVDTYTRFNTFLDDLTTVSAADVQRVAQTYLVETNRNVGWFVPAQEKADDRPATADRRIPHE